MTLSNIFNMKTGNKNLQNMNLKISIIAISIFAALTDILFAGEGKPFKREAYLSPVIQMYQHASLANTSGTNVLTVNDSRTQFAEQQFTEWRDKVIDAAWQPKAKLKLTCVENEFDGRDVVRGAWEINGQAIEVVQTAGIFLIKITPLEFSPTSETDREFQKAKTLCSQIFAKSGTRWTGQGEAVTIPNLSEKIATHFSMETNVVRLSNESLLLGYPAGLQGKSEAGEAGADWFYSSDAKGYWFANIHWMTDGKSMAFFFEKREGAGAIFTFPNTFSLGLDRNWFK